MAETNWVFVTNSDFLIVITLQLNVVDLTYFKLWIQLDQTISVYDIKGLHRQSAKSLGLENVSLWQRLNSFINKIVKYLPSTLSNSYSIGK